MGVAWNLWGIVLALSHAWITSGIWPLHRAIGSVEDTVFTPGTIPLDDTGQQMNVHEGWMLQIEDTYLWYGTNHKVNSSSVSGTWDWLSGAVNLYTSHDLATWHKKSAVFTAAALPAALRQRLAAAGPYRIERPKVLYNSARRYYVLIFHLDTIDLDLNQVGWAVSPSPYGPFNFQHASKPDDLGSLDMNVAVAPDAEGGSNSEAYLVRSIPGDSISISRLTSDYLSTTGVCTSIGPPPSAADAVAAAGGQAVAGKQGKGAATAAPCLFTYQGHWYLLATEHGGWVPSAPVLYVTDGPDLCGANWTELKRPARGQGAEVTFDSSPAFVLPYTFPGTSQVLLIYFGDRWNAQGPGSVGNASYVWLPLVPATGPDSDTELQLQLINPVEGKWRIGDYRPASLAIT